jgi:DNA-binding response OmpR family regulator
MKKILLLEDDKLFRSIICQVLLTKLYQVITAENGQVGLRLAAELEPDLIISDMYMPYLDGDKVLKQLRANLKTANISFICLTSENNSGMRSYALRLGANDYLVKPFKLKTLLKAIAHQLESKHLCCLSHK